MTASATHTHSTLLRQHAEIQFAQELAELAVCDQKQKPENW